MPLSVTTPPSAVTPMSVEVTMSSHRISCMTSCLSCVSAFIVLPLVACGDFSADARGTSAASFCTEETSISARILTTRTGMAEYLADRDHHDGQWLNRPWRKIPALLELLSRRAVLADHFGSVL